VPNKTKNDDSLYKATTEQCALGEATKTMQVGINLDRRFESQFGTLSHLFMGLCGSWQHTMFARQLVTCSSTWEGTYSCRKRENRADNDNDAPV
jgi:hypothetical protein